MSSRIRIFTHIRIEGTKGYANENLNIVISTSVPCDIQDPSSSYCTALFLFLCWIDVTSWVRPGIPQGGQ